MDYLKIYVDQYNKNTKEIKVRIDSLATQEQFTEVDQLIQTNQDIVPLRLPDQHS